MKKLLLIFGFLFSINAQSQSLMDSIPPTEPKIDLHLAGHHLHQAGQFSQLSKIFALATAASTIPMFFKGEEYDVAGNQMISISLMSVFGITSISLGFASDSETKKAARILKNENKW